jgi:hypothetical protein
MIRLTSIVVALLTVSELACRSRRPVHDGFESTSIGVNWDTRKLLPGAAHVQSSIVRAGVGALRITIRAGDQIPEERGTVLERAEIEEVKRLEATLDETYDYSFSLFLPQDFPIVPTRLVVAQWKQRCAVESCRPDNPTIALRYSAGEFLITHQVDAERRVLYRTTDDLRNQWLDFKFRIRFSRTGDGSIRAWRGGDLLVDYKGVNAYPEGNGFEERFYFKTGLYRDRLAEPMTMFIDEYRKERVPTD